MMGLMITLCVSVAIVLPVSPASGAELADESSYTMMEPVPKLFVHGYNDKGTSWEETPFYQYVQTLGVKVKSLDYSVYNRNDITSYRVQEIYEKAVAELLKGLPADSRFDIVVHSMGGLLTREYLSRHPAMYDRVRRVLFVGTPNHGAPVALLNRVTSMIDEPEEYWSGGVNHPDVQRYKQLYEQYIRELFDLFDGGPLYMGYEAWLVQEHPEVIRSITERQKEKAAPLNRSMGTEPLPSAVDYRYSGALEEYAKLLTGRDRVLVSAINVDAPLTKGLIDSGVMDESTAINELKSEMQEFKDNQIGYLVELIVGDRQKASAKNIVQDRLMYERFHLGVSVEEDGKLQYGKVISNLWLHHLWIEESRTRLQRIEKGQYVPQYITLATVAKYERLLIDQLSANKSAYDNEPHDSVVPLSSARLTNYVTESERMIDRNVEIIPRTKNLSLASYVQIKQGDYIFHSDQMKETKVIRAEYDHPLTGLNDKELLLPMDLQKSPSKTGRLVVAYPVDRTKSQEFILNLKSDSPAAVRIMKRDHYQAWSSTETLLLQPGDYSGYQAQYKLKTSSKVRDYLIVASRELEVSCGTEQAEEIPQAPYLVELLKTEQTGRRVVQTFRVMNRSSGSETGDFSKDDFLIRLDDKPFNHLLTVSQSSIQSAGSMVLELDYSGSMDGEPKKVSKYMAERFIGNLGQNSKGKIGVIGFADDPFVFSPLTTNYDSAKKSVSSNISGGTALYQSILAGVNLLSQEEGSKKLLVMTDGQNSVNSATLEQAVQAANRNNVSLYPIGLGNVHKKTLEQLGNLTNGRAYFTKSVGDLEELYNDVSNMQSYTYKVEFKLPEDEAEHRISIDLTGNRSIQSERMLTPNNGVIETIRGEVKWLWQKGRNMWDEITEVLF
jgi:pimeloyl-ACP methyl ester carboxylesterase/uncharacterized protein YegL